MAQKYVNAAIGGGLGALSAIALSNGNPIEDFLPLPQADTLPGHLVQQSAPLSDGLCIRRGSLRRRLIDIHGECPDSPANLAPVEGGPPDLMRVQD